MFPSTGFQFDIGRSSKEALPKALSVPKFSPGKRPSLWIRTLGALEKLDFETVLPGHGDILEGKQRLRSWKEYLTELMRQVSEQYSGGSSLEETLRNVDLSRYESRIPGFCGSVAGNIEKAYRVISFDD